MEIHILADLALAHTATTTQQFLAEFWALADWLPYSHDLSMLDFAILYVL
jgi:hypothetical protein